MYAPLLTRKAEILQQLGPKELETTKARINENQQKLQALMDNIAPEARQPVFEAFKQRKQNVNPSLKTCFVRRRI